MGHRKLSYNLIASLLIATSACLQLVNIGKWSFWFDESFTAMLIEYSPLELISRTASDVHPPLYYLVLKAWSVVFGSSDIALRSFSVLMTTAALGVCWLLLRRMFKPRIAILSLVLAVFNPFVIRYAQEARMYAMASLAIASSVWLLVKICSLPKKDRSIKWWLLYVISVAAMAYIHYFAVLAVIPQILYLAWTEASKSKTNILEGALKIGRFWISSYVAAFVLFLPWIGVFVRQLTAVNSSFWIEEVSTTTLQNTLAQVFLNKNIGNSSLEDTLILFAPVLLVVFVGYILSKLGKNQRQRSLLLIGCLAVPMILLYVVSILPFVQSVYYIRYFSQYAVIGVLGIGSVLAAGVFMGNKFIRMFSSVAVVMVLTANIIGLSSVYRGEGKSHFNIKELSQRIDKQYLDGDAIVASGIWEFYDTHRYSSNLTTVRMVLSGDFYGGASLVEDREDLLVDSLDDVVVAKGGKIWFVASGGDVEVPDTWQQISDPVYAGSHSLRTYILK